MKFITENTVEWSSRESIRGTSLLLHSDCDVRLEGWGCAVVALVSSISPQHPKNKFVYIMKLNGKKIPRMVE